MNNCPTPRVPMPSGYVPKEPCGCSCGNSGCGGCNGFVDVRSRSAPCCEPNMSNKLEIISPLTPTDECPPGTIRKIVHTAMNSPFFAPLFGCLDPCVLDSLLCEVEQFRLPGADNGDHSVILAAAHFFTLNSALQRQMQATMNRQAVKGDALAPFDVQNILSGYPGDTHWNLSSHGVMYFTMYKKPMTSLLGMAWGF